MNIDELEQSLLRAARRDLGPTASDRERHQAELMARIDGSRGGDFQRSAGVGADAKALQRPPASGVGWRAPATSGGVRLKLLGVGLVVGVVLGGLVGFGLGAKRGAPSLEPAVLAQASSAPSEGTSTVAPKYAVVRSERLRTRLAAAARSWDTATGAVARMAPEATVSDTGLKEAGSTREPVSAATPPVGGVPPSGSARESQAGAARSRSKRAAVEPATTAQSSLAIELAMLQRARRALNANNGRLALGLVHELDERFPQGVLVEERQATRVLSLCMLDRAAEARRFAARFLERYAGSVYAQRVRESCGADPPE